MSFIETKIEELKNKLFIKYNFSPREKSGIKSFLRTALKQQKQELIEEIEEIEEMKLSPIIYSISPEAKGYNQAISEVKQLLTNIKK